MEQLDFIAPFYFASAGGQIFSNRYGKLKRLKTFYNKQGYERVCLCAEGKAKNFSVHRLLMRAFHGDSCLQVNHIDGNKTNNNLSNLEYVTPSANIKHAHFVGLINQSGENNAASKLDDIKILTAMTFRAISKKPTIKQLAIRFKVSPSTLTVALNGKKWKHLPYLKKLILSVKQLSA